MNKPKLQVTRDFTKQLEETIKKFRKDTVVVGIPATDASREADPKSKTSSTISNAALLAINHFGSEKMGIPPRPVLSIGIRNAQDAIAEEFKKAAQNVLKKGQAAIDIYYERAGMIAANSVKKVINDEEGIQEPAENTIIDRLARGFKGTKALLVTGQLRNAITYVRKTK